MGAFTVKILQQMFNPKLADLSLSNTHSVIVL